MRNTLDGGAAFLDRNADSSSRRALPASRNDWARSLRKAVSDGHVRGSGSSQWIQTEDSPNWGVWHRAVIQRSPRREIVAEVVSPENEAVTPGLMSENRTRRSRSFWLTVLQHASS